MPIVGGPFKSLTAGATMQGGPFKALSAYANSYVTLPGTVGNVVSTPATSVWEVPGDLEIIARVRATDYTAAGNQRIVSNREGVPRGGYEFFIRSDGKLSFDSDKTTIELPASVAATATDGVTYWFRMTRTSSTGAVRYYQADDTGNSYAVPSSWTQVGTDVAGASGALTYGTLALYIGGLGTSFDPFGGRIYRTIVRDGIGGTTVADFDPNRWVTGTTFTSSDGLVYTLVGTAAITKA